VSERLEAAEPVRAVRAALADGPPAWLVGGVVRDALLGRALRDVDLAVDGDPEAVARAVARAVRGPAFQLSEEFGSWRAIDGERRFVCDVSRLQGPTIEDDLARRDFSVNAIAVPLAGGEEIDPHGGRADVEARVLRVLGEDAYRSDPLRTLRLARLAAELGFRPDPETERLTEQAAPLLVEPAPERSFAELRRLVVAPGTLAGLELAARLGLLAALLPELTALEGVEQSRFHHLDVFDHTIEVLRRLIELERDLESVFGDLAPRIRAELGKPLADEMTRGEALRLGALFHDVAKPATRGRRADGRVTFIGHDAAGQQMVGEIFRRLRTSERLRTYVAKLTREHLVAGFLVHQRPLSPPAIHSYLRRTQPVEVEVTLLSCADRLATRGADQEPWIAAHLELGRELMAAALEWRATGPPQPRVRGDELARELGIPQGPEIGALLERLEEAAYAGEVTSRDEALALARALRQNAPP
jgi:putative nucleotidyltransferase with HDIG domain